MFLARFGQSDKIFGVFGSIDRIWSHSLRTSLHIRGTIGPGPAPQLVLVDQAPYRRRLFERYRSIDLDATVDAVGDAGDPLLRAADPLPFDPDVRVVVFCTTDTLVRTLAPVIRHFRDVRILAPILEDAGVRAALERENLPYREHSGSLEDFHWAEVGLTAYDAGYEDRWFVAQCRNAGIPSVCLQEGTNVDFGPYPYRMEWADAVLLQGAYSLKYLDRDLALLTGNPRYDEYRPLPAASDEKVLINSNFLFNAGHEHARRWIEDVVAVVESAGLPYFVSVHPRDATDLTGIEPVVHSSAYSIQEQLAECTLVISRDSSIPHEALLSDRLAIYYNPHNEHERHLNEDDYGLIRKAYDREQLAAALQDCRSAPSPYANEDSLAVLHAYFGPLDGNSHRRVAAAVSCVARAPAGSLPADARRESASIAEWKTRFMRWGRPVVKPYPKLRALWRRVKTLAHPPRYE